MDEIDKISHNILLHTLPESLGIGNSSLSGNFYGVWSLEDIPEGTRFGPYAEITVDIGKQEMKDNCWQEKMKMSNADEQNVHSRSLFNWLGYINSSSKEEQQNLIMYECQGQIYYITSKFIPAYNELLTWQQANEDSEDSEFEESVHNSDKIPNMTRSYKWRRCSVKDDNFPKFPYSVSNPGPQYTHRPTSPLAYFQLFFTDFILNEIVAEVNCYAAKRLQKATCFNKHSLRKNWTETNLEELKAFLGVCINMGLQKRSSIMEYFTKDWIDKIPFFRSVFSRQRFFQLFWAFNLCHPSQYPAWTQISKMKDIVEYIDAKFQENFHPGPDIVIDESTLGSKGRVVFKYCHPHKPDEWKLRVFILFDCSTNYVYSFMPYYGKTTRDTLICPNPNLPLPSRIVLHMVNRLLRNTNGSGFHLYTGKYFTSPCLASVMLRAKVHITGTIATVCKGLPYKIKNPVLLKNGYMAYQRNENTLVLTYQDRRTITMYSTFHNASSQPIERREKSYIEITNIPIVITDYIKKIGTVNQADKYIGRYCFMRETKWLHRLLFWLLEMTIVNSYILYCHDQMADDAKPIPDRLFRKNLIMQLVGVARKKKV